MKLRETRSRRVLLGGAGAGMGAALLAACADRQSVRDAATKSAERATLLKAAEVDR
jgi:hypothetical protein